jgi:hypothetical protein
MQDMKQISEMEEKTFTSSLNIRLEACCRKGGGMGGVLLYLTHGLVNYTVQTPKQNVVI